MERRPGRGQGQVQDPADAGWPTLYLSGNLFYQPVFYELPTTILTAPPGKAFMVQNDSGTVAYINSQTDGDSNPPGSLVLAGYFFEGKNPDPQAQKIQFVLYDDFERTTLNPVSRYSTSAYGHHHPRMAENTGLRDWTIEDKSTTWNSKFLKNHGAAEPPMALPSRSPIRTSTLT